MKRLVLHVRRAWRGHTLNGVPDQSFRDSSSNPTMLFSQPGARTRSRSQPGTVGTSMRRKSYLFHCILAHRAPSFLAEFRGSGNGEGEDQHPVHFTRIIPPRRLFCCRSSPTIFSISCYNSSAVRLLNSNSDRCTFMCEEKSAAALRTAVAIPFSISPSVN